MAVAVLAGGCFWCTEAVFQMLKGVQSVEPGYAGGTTPDPDYYHIGDHAEAIKIIYDPQLIEYETLLTVFFATHDPTTLNRQGNDVGPQYRSLVLSTDEAQKTTAERFIAAINTSNAAGAPVVTRVQPLEQFYPAENYHRDYYANHASEPYCQVVINPKLAKVKQKFANLLKETA